MLQRLTPGQPLAISASTWDAHNQVAEYFRRNIELARGSGHKLDQRSSGLVTIANHTGDDIERGDVIEIMPDEDAIAQTQNHKLWFKGVGVDESRGFGIALDPIVEETPAEEPGVGVIQVAGVCKAKINIRDLSHRWARPFAGQPELESGHWGPCYILHRPNEVGEGKTATVIVAQPHMAFAGWTELTEDMCPTEDAFLDPEQFAGYKFGPFTLTPDPAPAEALNTFRLAGKSGDRVLVVYNGEEDDWEVWNVEPHEFEIGGRVELDLMGMTMTQSVLTAVVWTCQQIQPLTIADLTECPPEGGS